MYLSAAKVQQINETAKFLTKKNTKSYETEDFRLGFRH
jgi:hypothetical protein